MLTPAQASSPPTPSALLNQTLTSWSVQAAAASRYLTHLYRALGDGKQAFTAVQAGIPSERRVERLRLSAQVQALQNVFLEKDAKEIQREARAWQTLVESQAGISLLHALVDGQSRRPNGLRGARSNTTKAFQRSVQGYRVAFPEQTAQAGILEALRAAAATCTEVCLDAVGSWESPAARSETALEIHANILEALLEAAGLKVAHSHDSNVERRRACSEI